MREVSNPFQACSDILFKPNAVFATIDKVHNWSWLPFVLVMVMAILPSYLYFSYVDFEWYKDLVVSNEYADVSPSEQQLFRDSMTQSQIISFTVIGGFIGLIIVNAVVATYLNMMTRSDEENPNGFTDWYGFTWWISMPTVISGLIALLVILFSSNNQLDPASLAPTSLSYLFNMSMESDWYDLAQTIRLESFWSMYLIAVGVNQWTNLGANRAYFIAAVPYLAIWGIWALATIF